jgi:D-3-phosphoglycerate dehydrogenase
LEAAESEYADSELLELGEHVVISPHVAWYSEHSVNDLKEKTARNVLGVLQGGEPLFRVN